MARCVAALKYGNVIYTSTIKSPSAVQMSISIKDAMRGWIEAKSFV